MELWDAYDALGVKLNCSLVREEPLPANYLHVVATIAVRHHDGTWLLTRRDLNKPSYPGCWELSCGGSILKDETWYNGACRELLEETGIHAKSLVLHHTLISPETHSIHAGYLCDYTGDKDAIQLQENETIDYCWLTAKELLRFSQEPQFVDVQRVRWQRLLCRLKAENS